MPDLRPLAWLATLSFAIGFMGYLAVARPPPKAEAILMAPETAAASGPASEAWSFEKRL